MSDRKMEQTTRYEVVSWQEVHLNGEAWWYATAPPIVRASRVSRERAEAYVLEALEMALRAADAGRLNLDELTGYEVKP